MGDDPPKDEVAGPGPSTTSVELTKSDGLGTMGPLRESNSRRKNNVHVGGSFLKSSTVMLGKHTNLDKCRTFMNSVYLANFMGLIVVVDAWCTCMDIDATASKTTSPQVYRVISDLCLACYSTEVLALLLLFGLEVLRDWMMVVDVLIVFCGWGEKIFAALAPDSELGFRIAVLRAGRLVRIFRLMRLLKRIRPLRELHKLVMMMATCLRTLVWSFILLCVVMTVWAMLMVELIYPALQEMIEKQEFVSCDEECQRAMSSVMDANLLLFKTVIAGDSWGEIAVPVIQRHPATAIIFVGSQLTLVFGVLNLIVAVVVDTFADARQNDVQNLAEEMEDEIEYDRKSLGKLFERIDKDGSGQLTLQEMIEGARNDPGFQSRLRVMDIDEHDLQQLFQMIDEDGSGTIEVAEFIGPLSRWAHDSKTAPRFIKYNMIQTMHLQEDLYELSVDCFNQLALRIDDLASQVQGVKVHHPLQQDPAPSRSGSPMGSPTVEVIQSELPVEAAVSSESEPGTEVLEGQTSPVESRNVSRTSYWRSQPQPTPTRQVSPIQEQEKHFQEVDPSPSPPLDQPPPSADTELLAPKSASREARESSMGLEMLLENLGMKIESKLDLLLLDATRRAAMALTESRSPALEEFSLERTKARRVKAKKMLHPEAFRSMYMSGKHRRLSLVELGTTRDQSKDATPKPRRRSLSSNDITEGDPVSPISSSHLEPMTNAREVLSRDL